MWHFRGNVQIKTINYYTHIIILPTTLKQALLLPDPVYGVYISQEIYYKELPDIIMEAGKSQELQLASWKCGRANAVDESQAGKK